MGDRRTAERLIILRNYTQGLLTRCYVCVNFRFAGTVQKLPQRVVDHFGSKKEDPTLGLEKVTGYEQFNSLAHELEQECSFCFATVEDIMNASREMENFFSSLAGSIASFQLQQNPDLTQQLLHVFTNYVKLHLLASRFQEARTAVYIYLKAKEMLQQSQVENANIIKDYLWKIRDPIRYLQHQASWDSVGHSLVECLTNLQMAHHGWSNTENIKASKVFDLMQKPEQLPQPISAKANTACVNGSITDQFTSWTIFIYLVFPEHLANDISRNHLSVAFRDRYAVTLFRDEVLDVRASFNNLKCLKPKVSVKFAAVNKLWKGVKAEDVVKAHQEMRTLLLETLRHFVDLMDTLPGVVPAKLPAFIVALNLARSEVMWMFEHLRLQDMKEFIKKKYFFPNTTNRITELMYYITLVAKKLTTSQMNKIISDYHKEKLQILLGDLTTPLGSIQGAVDNDAVKYCGAIERQLRGLNTADSRIQILEGMRLNWYRTSAILSKPGQHLKNQDVVTLTRVMNNIVQCSRYYDNLSKEVERATSFADLWFYRKYIANFFNAILRVFKEEKKLICCEPSQCRFLMVFLAVFEQAMNNVHKQYPQEREHIGEDAVVKAEAYLKSAASFVKDCCANIVMGFNGLANQLDSIEVALKLNKQPNKRDQQVPGMESLIQNESMAAVRNLRNKMKAMGMVCGGFRETEKLIVFDKQMFPNAYLYNELVEFFRQQVNKLLVHPKIQAIQRPSVYSKILGHLLRAYHHIGSHLNIEIEHMIRKVMFDECNDELLGHVGQSVFPPMDKMTGRKKLIHKIADYYVNLIESCVNPKNGRVYSPFEKGFYDLKTKEPSIQDFTTPIELQCLCRLLGPGGVRVIDHRMIHKSDACIDNIKTVLAANQVMVGQCLDASSSGGKWGKTSATFRYLDKLTQESIRLGLLLCFRQQLRKALKVIANEKTPFMSRSVDLIHERLLECGVIHNKFNTMALDFGVVSALSDSIMHTIVINKLRDEDKSKDPEKELEFYRTAIPVLYGFMFSANDWKNVKFDVPTGALDNNGMCIAHTLQLLLDAVAPLNRRQEISRKLKLDFLRYASLSLLNLNTDQFLQQFTAHKSRDLLCFLDYFILLDDDLNVSDLEQAGIPYAMIRSQYVRLYGKANDITRTEGLVQMGDVTDE